MTTKYITFNYFEPMLVPAEQALEADLMDDGDIALQYMGDLWNMEPFMDFLAVENGNLDLSYSLGDEYADVEPGSFIKRNNLSHIQVSKLRETNIPAKKKIGEIKQEILLNDDEYIGEFNSILYDNNLNVLMIQSNHYGLSTKQLEYYLTELRFRFLENTRGNIDEPLLVKLNPIIDQRQLDDALKANYYRKIRIRGADLMEDVYYEDDTNLINDVARTLNKAHGVNIDLVISVGRADRTKSLDNQTIINTLNAFMQLEERKRPNIELTLLENEEAQIETINLIRPRLRDRVPFTVEPRTIIGHEFVCNRMIEYYLEKSSLLRRALDRR